MRARKTARERFEAKVLVAQPGCWLWQAKLNRDGYGAFWDGSHNGKGQPVQVLAHRWAYEHFYGRPIPLGQKVCHRCDTPACVNPAHLFLGSQRDNVHDAIRKGRHASARTALTQSDAESIRAAYSGRYGDIAALARRYGSSKKLISHIVHRQGAWT